MSLYQRYFGFRRAPFELVPDPDFLFLGESHDSALANLVAGIEAGKGFVAITGPIGTGKTTILRALLRRIGRTDRLCFLSQPEADVADLLTAILDGFGAPAPGAPLVELRRRVREFLSAGELPGILILDEAHLLHEDALEQIRLLSNLEDDHRKLLQIVLSGQPELKTLLSSARLKPLAQRIEMFYEIRPLALEETCAYLARRLQIAAGSPGAEFEPRAAAEIHECTGGIPRLINVLADRALLSAYVAETRLVTPQLVAEAYEDLGAVTHAVMPGKPSRRVGKRRSRTPAVESPLADGDSPVTLADPVAPARSRRPMRILGAVSLGAVLLLGVVSLGSRSGRLGRAGADPERITSAGPPPAPAMASPAVEPPAPSAATPPAALPRTSAVAMPTSPAPRTSPTTTPTSPVPQKSPVTTPTSSAPTTPSVTTPTSPRTQASPGGRPMSSAPAPASAAVNSPTSPGASASGPPATPPPGSVPALDPGAKWTVHVASLQKLDAAQELAGRLRSQTGLRIRIAPTELEGGIWYRVLVGEYDTTDAARAAFDDLRARQEFAFVRIVRLPSDGAPPKETP